MNQLKEQFRGQASKNLMPRVEELCENLWYTFNYNPEVQPALLMGEVHFDDWFIDQLRHFQEYSKYADIQLALESSPTGRLHWHGVIRFNNLCNFIIRTLPLIKSRASSEIDHLSDKALWHDYCTKQLHIFGFVYKTPRIDTSSPEQASQGGVNAGQAKQGPANFLGVYSENS